MDSLIAEDFCQPMILRQAAAAPLLRLNNDFTTVFGFTETELASSSLLSWIHPEDSGPLEKILAAEEGQVQARHRTKKGSWQPLSWRVKAQDGQVVVLGSSNQGSTNDIRRDQDESSLLTQTLTTTLEAMVRVVESKNPGLRCSILLIDSDQEHVSVGAGPSLPDEYNAAVEGLRIGPAVGSCGTAAFWNVPVVVENIAEDPLWKDLRDAAAIANVACCWSVPLTAVNNSILGAMALYDVKPAGPTRRQMDLLETSARMVGLTIERDRLELHLREATKMQALGVLAGGVAHDFNNLLSAVIGNAELAMRRVPEGNPIMHHLEQIINASVTATDLCNQMLAFTGQGVSTTEKFNCNDMVQQTGELLKAAISKKVNLQYQLHESPLGVMADKSQLRQVLMNLITNASESYC
ncbi:MAG: GAF domain-containing protein, partial [Halioglobus sp.]|nr:GAF domain-containing protein [Halioglobus sp.]